MLASAGIRLRTREQLAADNLRIGLQEPQSITMAIFHQLVLAKIRKRGIELHVAGKRLPGGPHQWIFDVVTNAGQCAKADQFAAAKLRSIASDASIGLVVFGQTQFVPCLYRGPIDTSPTADVFFIGFVIVKQIELDELYPLVLEIEQRPIDPSPIGT